MSQLHELKVTLRRAGSTTSADVSERLLARGLALSALVEQEERGRQQVCAYFRSAHQASRWIAWLRSERLPGVALRLRVLRDADWQDTWKRHLRPFAIARGLRVVPAWSPEAKHGPSERRIVLETGLAFGTGKHPTTRWVAQCIRELQGRFQHVLDVGLGSGVLAVVAHRCGASRIVGVDIDGEAVRVSRRNLAANGFRSARLIHADFKTLKPAGTFDLVLANIGAAELLGMRRQLIDATKPDGHLVLAGIPREQAARFRRQFADPALRCRRAHLASGWAGFLYHRQTR